MLDRKMNRSWTIAAASAVAGAAALSFGLFLAVSKDSLADAGRAPKAADDDQKVKVVTVTTDGSGDVEAETAFPDADAFAADADDEVHGTSKGGYLGLSLKEDTKNSEGGAFIERIVHDSPASKAGLKVGDVIVGFGGDVVRGPAKVTEKLHAANPGDKVVLDVRRDGKVQKVTAELGKRTVTAWTVRSGDFAPMTPEAEKALEESLRGLDEKNGEIGKTMGKMKFRSPGFHRLMILGGNKPLLGIEMLETSPDLREAMGGSKEAGVLVGKVLAGSAAEKCGVKVGDLILSIDGEKVSEPGELSDLVGKREGKSIDIDLVRDKRTMHLKALLPKIDEPEDEQTGPRASIWRMPACAPGAMGGFLMPTPAPAAAPAPPAPPAFAPMAVPALPALPAPPAPPAPPILPKLSSILV